MTDELSFQTEILNRLEKIEEKLDRLDTNQDSGAEMEESSGHVRVVGPEGGFGSKEVAELANRADKSGVDASEADGILGTSRKTTLKIMREMAEQWDHLEFRKGRTDGPNQPSVLKKTTTLSDEADPHSVA